jgi:formate hydrogenlyase subunit 3/multisubunit Na+/H+ antiporter MnhD subunit
MMAPEQLVFVSILACVVGALLTLIAASHRTLAGWIAFLVTAATGILIFCAVGRVMVDGPAKTTAVFTLGLNLRFHVDGLTSLFLLLAAFIAMPAALYSIAYMKRYAQYSVARYYPCFLIFLAAMYGLLSTTDMTWFFFIFWQMMTLPGYVLIRFEKKERANRRAANRFLVMMQIACLATMAGALFLGGLGGAADDDFDTASAAMPAFLASHPGLAAAAFASFLVGFGIKMGMWPFGQLWLPDAHPAAPSPVSAMLSGVMIKTGVYGLIRYFLWLTPVSARAAFPLAGWGWIVAALGTITLFTGTMQALRQEQTKRLLAYHSIGQVGYILLGIGACMVLLPAAPALAALALFGALFHVLNHGVFKALLFLNAGSMLQATDTQDLNQMGGLMKYMPLTAVTALVASLSISGVPLFNGFASKWNLYVAMIQGSGVAGWLAVCAAIAILTSALTLASFIKFFGASFLSRGSALVKSKAAQRGRLEVGWLMQWPQLLLALVCVLLGVAPALAGQWIRRALLSSPGGLVGAPVFDQSNAVFVPWMLILVLGTAFLGVLAVSRLGGSARRSAAPWLCGEAGEEECNRYAAHHFYGDVKRYFRWLGGARKP